ncbi:macrophage colony-stimulating factor 1 [Aquarana catesbeiana]|uniref:macrophage colony-stimulating factor 1 n=1 Tax=Aquarana catesbeiana TaxID=8400 RepID=UPI003CCA6CAC
MAYLCVTLIFIYLATCAQAEKKCLSPITDQHLNYLDEMIDAQLEMPCSVKMKLMDNKIVGDYCYKRGVISQLSTLLEKLEFKPNSQSYNYTKRLNDLYDQRFQECIDENDDLRQEDLVSCSRNIDLNPVQLLERIKTSFVIFRDFTANLESEVNCFEEYRMCKEEYDHSAKGPQCACPSPTTPIASATSTQKSLSNLSEIKSSPYASIIPFSTVSITEYTSGTDLENPQQSSSESLELSSVILTSPPTEVQTLTTIMDHLHAATTDRLVSGPESPRTKMDISFSGMEFNNGITESAYTTSLSQTRTYPEHFNMASLKTDGSHAETLSTTNTVLNKDFSQQTGELPVTSVTEPVVGELVETTELNIVSQSSVSNFQKYYEPSTEPTVESSSTVTKVRRSVENVDKTLKVYVSTHPQPVLMSDDRTTMLLQLTSSIPPTVKSLQAMQQKNEIRNLGWAASYIFPAVVTTKPASSDTKMPPPVSGVQSLPSEASLHPKLIAHEGGYTYNNQQLEQNLAAFISEDRANRGAGPVHGSNPLPILETEQRHHGRQNSNLFLVMIPSILAILFLCGLLYSVYRYRRLIRQLNREQVQELHELRPLAPAV